MSRLPLQGLVGGLIVMLGLAACAAGVPPVPGEKLSDQKPAPAKDGAENKRLLYIVKHGAAKDLAALLGQHFKDAAEVQALPNAAGDCLLISASPSVFDEVVKTLEQLDRRPHAVSIEVLIAEVASRKPDGDKAEEVDEKDFAGPIDDVIAKVKALRKKGVLGDLKHVQLAAVEGQPASVLIGEDKAYVMGVTTMGTGRMSRSVTYHNTGLQVEATARVSPENVIALDIKVEDSQVLPPEEGVSIGTDENGKSLPAAEFGMTKLTTSLSLASGQARVAEGAKTGAKADKVQTLTIVGARVIEPDEKADK